MINFPLNWSLFIGYSKMGIFATEIAPWKTFPSLAQPWHDDLIPGPSHSPKKGWKCFCPLFLGGCLVEKKGTVAIICIDVLFCGICRYFSRISLTLPWMSVCNVKCASSYCSESCHIICMQHHYSSFLYLFDSFYMCWIIHAFFIESFDYHFFPCTT